MEIIFMNTIIQRKFFEQTVTTSMLNGNYFTRKLFTWKFTSWKIADYGSSEVFISTFKYYIQGDSQIQALIVLHVSTEVQFHSVPT